MPHSPRQLKYVIVSRFGVDCAIIFNDILDHSVVVKEYDYKAISAGFCRLSPDRVYTTVTVWGESTTLKLKSRAEDKEIIERTLNEFCP